MGWQHFLNVAAYNPYWVLIGFLKLVTPRRTSGVSGYTPYDTIHGKDEVISSILIEGSTK